jgi:hypothetical protein
MVGVTKLHLGFSYREFGLSIGPAELFGRALPAFASAAHQALALRRISAQKLLLGLRLRLPRGCDPMC